MGWLHGVKTTHNNHVYTKLSTNISPSKRKTTKTTQQQNFWVYMSFPAKNSPEKMIESGGGAAAMAERLRVKIVVMEDDD
ncbi:hypothetical protein P8452_38829 [Trifolium repens]|nr:hypothetical protein P8452_38829 [Trifolium repens]